MKILKSKRKQLIMEKLSHDKFVNLEDLVSMLDTSSPLFVAIWTNWRVSGKLHRVHGGAELPHSLQVEFTISTKIYQKHSRKNVSRSESS